MFCAVFLCLQFVFVIFWQKEIGAKAARKMLVRLTIGCSSTSFRGETFPKKEFVYSAIVLLASH